MKTLSRRLEHVWRRGIRRIYSVLSRRLQDVFKISSKDEDERSLQDIFKMSSLGQMFVGVVWRVDQISRKKFTEK